MDNNEYALAGVRRALQGFNDCDHEWQQWGIKDAESGETLVNYVFACRLCDSLRWDHGDTIKFLGAEAALRRTYARLSTPSPEEEGQ